VRRVVVLGRGGAGKSALAVRLGAALDLPVVELDGVFWPPDLTPMPADRCASVQRDLVRAPGWVLDGDLGPHDVLPVRLAAADTVVVLDFPRWRCALPVVLAAVAEHADGATVHVLRDPAAVERFLA
jgi:adenylate kinase family enzyme